MEIRRLRASDDRSRFRSDDPDGFRAIDVVEGLSDARPRPTPMFLPTSEIRAATPRRPKR